MGYKHLNDHWDLDHPFERLLVDTAVAPDPGAVSWINPRLQAGEVRSVVTGIPGKTGVVYTLDRATGEFLWATPTTAQNVITAIDGATGDVTENAEIIFTALGQEILSCPAWNGGKDWEAGAYSPLTNTMYMPLRNACSRVLTTLDHETGEVLWEINLGSSVTGFPITYAVDGRQYVAVSTGNAGTASMFTGLTPEISPSRGNDLFVFALPE